MHRPHLLLFVALALPVGAAFLACGSGGDVLTPPVDVDAAAPQRCAFPAAPASTAPFARTEVYADLGIAQPLGLFEPTPGVMFVQERGGKLRRFPKVAPTPATTKTVFEIPADRLDIRGEGGFLGLAFSPDFPATPKIYVSYTYTLNGTQMRSAVDEVTSTDGGETFDYARRRTLLDLAQPFTNHNGGALLFGADQRLYVAFGDGGSGGDPQGNGQNTNVLLGKILRIDPAPSGGDPYTIPADNPFVARAGFRPEIFALGLRNPWRFTRDRATGELYAGDVGQNAWEEVDRIVAGGNYGWNSREGRHCYGAEPCDAGGPFEAPLVEHPRTEARSITGGYVYRGSALPALRGRYIYGDYVTGNLFAFDPAAGTAASPALLTTVSGGDVAGFAEDHDGELYVLRLAASRIEKLVPAPPAAATDPFPTRLSQTGCVVVDGSGATATPVPALVRYTPIAPFWSDGAEKDRAFTAPLRLTADGDGDYRFPALGVAMKTFRDPADQRPLETRFFVRHADGSHAGYTYLWRPDGHEADLAQGGEAVRGTSVQYTLPSRGDCMTCHQEAAGYFLGLEAAQLAVSARNALETQGVVEPVSALARTLVPPFGADELPLRAASYLHSNCAGCHRPGGSGRGALDLRAEATLAAKGCDRRPETSDLGVADARVIAPGDPSRSVLALRMRRSDVRMPPLGSRTSDAAGIALIESWIRALPGCTP